MDIGPDDVGLRLHAAVPLQRAHGRAGRRRIVDGASVGLARRFSVSRVAARHPSLRRHVLQLHRQAARPTWWPRPSRPTTPTTPCGWPSATRGRPRSSTGSPAASAFEVIDAFGATEGGVAVNRERRHARRCAGPGRRRRHRSSTRRATPKPVARFDADGRLLNADECVGEIVNTAGVGPFEGYYNNDEANAAHDPERLVLERRPRLPRRRPATSTSPAATPTGSASTARTSPPDRSRPPSSVTPTWWWRAVYGVPDLSGRRPGDGHGRAAGRRRALTPWPSRPGSTPRTTLGPKWRPRYVRVASDIADHRDQQDRQAGPGRAEVAVRPGGW